MPNMKKFRLIYLFCLIFLTITQATGIKEQQKYKYLVKFLDVTLDHFSYTTNKTFQLRYLINDSYSSGNDSPILFYTGNEGDIELFAQNTGFMWEAAEELRSSIIFAEHRYYGQSLPFGNDSFKSDKYGYLTAEQALADYAELLYHITEGKMNRPVVAVGGSYGGMLAAWFRMKYPHMVIGALAASAPILQFQTPCDVFNKIVTSVFSTDYDNCSINIKKSWSAFKTLSSSQEGLTYLNKKFLFCESLTKIEDLQKLFDYLEDLYGNLAMVNYPYENSFLAPLPAYPVRAFCSSLSKQFSDDHLLIDAMQTAISIYANYTGMSKCLNYTTAYEPSLGASSWGYQTCTEMIMPMCSDGIGDMFLPKMWNFKKYSNDCYEQFKVHPREHEILTRFGGDHLKYTTNIIFSNGLLDPWSGGGVLRTQNNKIYVIIIPEGAHHLDLRGSHPKDPVSILDVRRKEIKLMKSWIYDSYDPFSFY